ncbi:MAG: PAS domain S-box protein [Fimbriimonadales bacterium]
MEAQTIPVRLSLQAVLRYVILAAGYLAASLLLSAIGRAPLTDKGEITLRPDLALAILLFAVFGWSFVPVAASWLLLESVRTSPQGIGAGDAAADALLLLAVAVAAAYCIRKYCEKGNWGSQRDFLILGGCTVALPVVFALGHTAFFHLQESVNPYLLSWLSAAVPMAAIVPAGMKLADWVADPHREPLFAYLGRGVQPSIQAAQFGMVVLATGFIWIERVSGGPGRIYPLFIAVFWMALTSGLPAAAFGYLIAEGLLVTVNSFARPTNSVFDLQLSATVMGLCSLVAGSLVTARRDAEEKQREQGEALRRQLAEMQVIRRLADSIIALREEAALYELGAEAIGEQLGADQVWLLWLPSGGDSAEDRGFWASAAQTQRDKFVPNLCSASLMPLWRGLEESRTQLVSRADIPDAKLTETKLDVSLHQASGIKTLVFHPFSFEPGGFHVAAILSYRRFRHWTPEDLQFVTAVSDQITIALQKTRLLGEREERSRAFARMSQALVAETGESFFRNLVLRLSEAAGSRGAYASRVGVGIHDATMLAFADSGRVRKEFTFKTEGTPVDDTMREGSLAVEDMAVGKYPRFTEITSVEARGFASTRLAASDGEPLGTLAIYDDKPLEDPEHIASVLRLFAARASAEIERLERERLLRESEASYRRVLETAHEGIWMVDADGKTTYVNVGMASMLGYTPEEMTGRSLQDFVDEEDRVRVALDLQHHLVGAASQHDFRFRRHDGSFVWTLVSMSPIRDEDGEYRGALAMITDISERKRTEQELDRLVHERTAELVASNRELEAFCYSISHDLRQPLRAIDGFSRAVVEDLGEEVPHEVKDHLARVRRAANRMSELIDALLTLSRLNRVEMKREQVDLSEIAESLLAELVRGDPSRAKGHVVRKGLTAIGDARLLHIALENLLGNAWKFSARAEHPVIEFGSKKLEGKTCYYVRDNGIGFDMAYSGKLFKPFERLHSDSEFHGTGIGLATVARIIARHGGQIWAEGAVGKGATFYFTL